MGIRKVLRNLLPLVAISCACAFAQIGTSGTANRTAQNSVRPFLGRWDMTLRTPEREYPSWLEIYQVNGAIKANMVGRWGSAHPLPKVEISHGVLTFTSPRKYEGRKTDMDFRAKLIGDALVGSTTGPHGKPWPWTAKRVPALIRTAEPRWGKRISLFNGKNLDGWYQYPSPDSPQAQPWKVVNGILISPAVGSNLATKRKFEDFKLHVEFNCGPVSNSGVYLRGRYEVQIENDSVKEPPSHHTGGIYGFIAPSPELPRTTGKWQSFDITLVGRKVTVVQDGKTIVDNQEIPGITGGAMNSHEGMAGPIMLQGGEKGNVSFRNLILTPALKGYHIVHPRNARPDSPAMIR